MPEKKTLKEDLFYKGSSANLPRLHTCKNKVRFGILKNLPSQAVNQILGIWEVKTMWSLEKNV